tara:strand:- start:49 stop:606 length:558 start_codon:yes stop_codon:yes gene_type:complete
MKDSTFKKYCLVVDEWFVNGFNGVKAYQTFYPKASRDTADSKFRRVVEIGRIQEYINTKQGKAQSALSTSHEALLKELQNWAYSDITQTLLLSSEQVKSLPEDVRRLITKFKHTSRHTRNSKGKIVETVETVELHFIDKTKAMDMINRHTGFYEKDNNQNGGGVVTGITFEVFDARKGKGENGGH